MADGMIIRRTSGETVIDNSYKPLALSQVIDQFISAPSGPAGTVFTLSVSGENVMVACSCSALEFSMHSASVGGSSATINFIFRSPSGSPTSETVRFYVFANPTFGADDFGIKLYDASGTAIFSNFSKPIRISAVVPGTNSFTGTAGRIYAPIILTRYDDITYNNGVIWNIRYSFLQSAGSAISANMRTVRTGSIRRASTSGSYLAADVTDY